MRSITEWKSDHGDMINIVKECKSVIREIVPNSNVILYGSYARGDSGVASDIDLLILVTDPVDYALIQKIRNQLFNIELREDIIISSIVRNEKEWYSRRYLSLPLKQEIDVEGVVT